MKKFLFLSGIFLLSYLSVSAQFVLFKIPVKDAVTRKAINAKGKVFLVTDTADVYTGNNLFCLEEYGGIIEVRVVENSNNTFRIEIVGSKLIEEKDGMWWIETDEYEAESVTIRRKNDMSFPYILPTVYLKKRSKE